jgi:hypothetical protein
MRSIPHFVGGRAVEGTSGRFGDVFDPNTGKVQARVALASTPSWTPPSAAAAAQPAWAATNPQRRARVMFEFKRLLEPDMDELAELLSSEHGKVIADSKGDISAAWKSSSSPAASRTAEGRIHRRRRSRASTSIRCASRWASVAGITPFNFPAMIPMWMMGRPSPAATPSSSSPRSAIRRCRCAGRADDGGRPAAGVLNVVHGDKDCVDAILDHPDIKAVSFVGSSDIAQSVYQRGTAHGKRVQAMGGAKNHGIVLPDADLDQAVKPTSSARPTARPASAAWPCRSWCRWARRPPTPCARSWSPPSRPCASASPPTRTPTTARWSAPPTRRGSRLHPDGRRRGRRAGRRRSRLQPARPRGRLLRRPDPVRPRQADHADLPGRDLRPGAADGPRREPSRRPSTCPRAPVRQRRGDLHPQRRRRPRVRRPGRMSAWSASTCRSRCRSPITASAAGSARASAT